MMISPIKSSMKQSFSNKWLVFLLVAVGIFMSTLDGSIVNIALPTIMSDLVAPLSTVEWVLMIYLLTVSSLLLGFGRLSDIKGRRWVYCRGLFIFSVGSLLCGIASNVIWLIAARSFQGVGAAMIMSCTPALIMDTFPVAERGKALGMLGAVVASGLTAGPAVGGLLLHYFSWQAIFYINIPIGLVTAIIVARVLKGGSADVVRTEAFDWAGALLLIFCLSCSLLAITHGYDWGYNSTLFVLLMVSSIASGAAFIWVEFKTLHPLFDLSLFKTRLFTLPILSATILFMSLFTMVFLMPFYLMHPCGFAVNLAGYIMVTPFVALFALAPVSGIISDRTGSRVLCTFGMGILTLALFFLTQLTPGSSPFAIAWRMGLAGVGTAIFIAPNSSTCMSAVPPARRGLAAATVAAARNLGMVTGIAMAGAIFNSVFHTMSGGLSLKVYHPDLEPIFMTAFRYAMLAGAVAAGIGMILAFLRGPEKRVKG